MRLLRFSCSVTHKWCQAFLTMPSAGDNVVVVSAVVVLVSVGRLVAECSFSDWKHEQTEKCEVMNEQMLTTELLLLKKP